MPEGSSQEPVIRPLPSLLDLSRIQQGHDPTESEALFYTCPQCGHAMVSKKCKIVCKRCHYFIGCVE